MKNILKVIIGIVIISILVVAVVQSGKTNRAKKPPKEDTDISSPVNNNQANNNKDSLISSPSSIVWSADNETGDLSQWAHNRTSNTSQDSGLCTRPGNGVSDEVAHSGKYSVKMTINSWIPKSGCRQFRYPEARSGEDYYYSAWIYLPNEYKIGRWSNLVQFKAKSNDAAAGSPSKLFWALRIMNREDNGNMYLQLHWDDENGLAGPTINDPVGTDKYYTQEIMDLPSGKWFHIEVFLKQSGEFDGEIIVWQDGTEIFHVNDVRTKMPNGYNSWSINSYGGYTMPAQFTVFVDDAVISKERIGPEFKLD